MQTHRKSLAEHQNVLAGKQKILQAQKAKKTTNPPQNVGLHPMSQLVLPNVPKTTLPLTLINREQQAKELSQLMETVKSREREEEHANFQQLLGNISRNPTTRNNTIKNIRTREIKNDEKMFGNNNYTSGAENNINRYIAAQN